ncbi:HAD family hydrolase [Alteromonas aestuariivivens]|uniref:HAD family hydrolase n=1 Tax=Alteromonas aestuariivivens TaxID=1938339 RepID=A0A3D8M7K7_9ALTE|nr:HAD-IA family hydrolase [Alteromonas aestuariivivens]RDV25527.1 HAD family hydrolase [Alteromonas aestuariivivens]
MRFYRPLKPVSAITFDLDDTLYDNGPVIRKAEQHLQQFIHDNFPHAAQLTAADWKAIKRAVISEQPKLASDMGQLRLNTLQVALRNDCKGESALQEAAKACFDCFYHARSELELEPGVVHTLDQLSQRVPMIGITNGNVDVQRIGLAPYFKGFLHASVERPMKPHGHMFEEAACLLGAPAETVLHVGDNLEKDVFGAIAAGMQAAWYAADRPMLLSKEDTRVLPHVELEQLDDLLRLVN